MITNLAIDHRKKYKQLVEDLAVQGNTYDEISESLGVGKTFVESVVQRMENDKKEQRNLNLLIIKRNIYYYDPELIKRFGDEKINEMRIMYRNGKPAAEIAVITGIYIRDVFAIVCGTDYVNKMHFDEKEIKIIERMNNEY